MILVTEQKTCCLCHAPLCDITRQMRETSSRQRQNTDRKRRHASVTHPNSVSWMGVRKTEKRTTCPSRPSNNSWVATQTRRLLNEHTCWSHEWRIFQTCALANMLRIVSSSKSKKQRRFKNCFFEIVLLLAFVGNGRSIVLTRTLNFGGACAKPFAKIQQLVPTSNSTPVNTFSNTTSNVRAVASQSNTASLRIVVRTRRILSTISSKSA